METQQIIPENGTLGQCRHCGAGVVYHTNLKRWLLDATEPMVPEMFSEYPKPVTWAGIHLCSGPRGLPDMD